MIIVGGCSWSDPNWKCESDVKFDTSFPKWYELLDTDKEVKSIAKSGSGNQTQIELLINEIKTNNKVTEILLGLSDWLRFSIYHKKINPQLSLRKDLSEDQKRHAIKQDDIVNVNKLQSDDYIPASIQTNLTFLHALSDVCDKHDIRLHVFQMLRVSGIDDRVDLKYYKSLITHSLFEKLDDTNMDLLGMPWIEWMNGINMNSYIHDNEPHDKAWRVSNNDMHPNRDGHQAIADWINDNITWRTPALSN
mgnify:CR=1 FL=1|tara:strand:- start:544 stop:1290 length:747 start_codon:yes stop_codon:yes gene_type:complete